LLRKQANAFEHLGAYSQAVPLYAQALEITQRIASQDPKDLRALYDVVTVLDDEATSYEDAANPILAARAGERRVNLILAEKTLVQAAADLEQLLKQDPANDVWKAYLANTQVRIGIIRGVLHSPNVSEELSRKSLAVLKEVAEKDQASPLILDQAANAFLWGEPASLRNAQFAVSCAEREVAMSHGKMPFRLLTLAQAYRASGQIGKSRATAMDGLALLPVLQPGSVKPNIRKLLENEVQTHF
jgi:tetratricopeptide (TPR) repeat protein